MKDVLRKSHYQSIVLTNLPTELNSNPALRIAPVTSAVLGFNRVRAGSLYRYTPVAIDRLHPPHNVNDGDIVRVINLPGCPRANTMGHAHVEHLDGAFGGRVCTNSLTKCEGGE